MNKKSKHTLDSLFPLSNKSLKDKKEFYSSLSHIFRGPLVGATGYVDFLFKGYAGPLKSSQMKPLVHVRESILQLSGVIDTFLDMTAFDLGLIESGKEHTDLCSQTKAIAVDLKELLAGKHVSLNVISPSTPLPINMSPHWLKTMLYELTINALRLTNEKGKININITEIKNSFAAISLQNTGPRIILRNKGDIFCPFFRFAQADYPQEERRGGLGLSLVKRIISAHNGKIEAVRPAKGGLKISVQLPLKYRDRRKKKTR